MLWSRGDLGLLDRPTVAIVGTRRATAYAERVTRQLAGTLARAGATVISGLARGVDAAAHRGALEADGGTVAVLGTGLDVCYPRAHASLQREIGERGLLLSELAPHDAAHPGSFPRRNRIIAALARVTVVVEAGVKSGALITAGHAADLGRTVAALPGPIDVPGAAGTNALLRDGAHLVASVDDVLALAGCTPTHAATSTDGAPPAAPPGLAPDERALWDALGAPASGADALVERTGLPVRRCITALTALELAGLVESRWSGEIARR